MARPQMEFVYLVQKNDGTGLHVRYKDNISDYIKDIDAARDLDYSIKKVFKVNPEYAQATIEACSEYADGEIKFDDLEKKVQSISDNTKSQ